ncbi:uncharacterized protein K460DRAFT_172461 [Cucurbitaria berberidis CBS 394.84]|uniref:Uncharacterized protein n=1 Tax=Cucurbitaria berberidis CBS 394.84 TaxID=1168544 RepID=A0A9P4G9P9_9PLEO|nr:uncharacterized protein K460DRAFT_172461 [Cucurbitaria berberidis CBS 394.84]KAF1841743.1 hypothetical protein K460DRAFT_172461 [Cucurbitaria berberidis CBS 394.84]
MKIKIKIKMKADKSLIRLLPSSQQRAPSLREKAFLSSLLCSLVVPSWHWLLPCGHACAGSSELQAYAPPSAIPQTCHGPITSELVQKYIDCPCLVYYTPMLSPSLTMLMLFLPSPPLDYRTLPLSRNASNLLL